VLGCIGAGAALGLVPALVLRDLIDYLGRADAQFGHVAALIGVSMLAAVLGGAIGVFESYLTERISEGIIFDLREQMFGSLVHQSVGFYTSVPAGEVMSRMTNDIEGVDNVVAETVFGVVSNAITAATTLTLMVVFDWRLTLIALGLLPLLAIPTRRAGRRVYTARGHTQRKLGELTAYLQAVLGISGALLIISAVMRVLQTAGPALLILAGGWLVIHQGTSVGTVFIFATVLTQRFGLAAGSLGDTDVNLIGSLALFRRLFTVIDHPPEVADRPGARELASVEGAIAFDDVTFAYPTQTRPALAGLSAPISTTSRARCPRATRRSSASAAIGCQAARSSASRSRARSSRTRASCCSTRPRSNLDTLSEQLIQAALRPAVRRAHLDRDRAPALDDPRGRPDPRAGSRPARRTGHPLRAARARRPVRRALRAPVPVRRSRRTGLRRRRRVTTDAVMRHAACRGCQG
jgi:ABC-type bacteriocin/lantibiotic exporter with double-glycine peptidase domain